MRKKRKIKVPAAIYGLSNNTELQSSITRGIAPNDPSNLAQATPFKSGSNLAGALGTIGGVAQALPGAINMLSSPFQTSTATTGGEAAAQSVTDIVSGIGSGASMGMSVAGPIGAAVGGAAGLVTGLIGKKGKSAEMSSFTDFDEGSLGTGLIGAFKNKKLRKRRAYIRTNAYKNREAVAATERLQNAFNEDNTEFDTDVFAYGGSIPSSLAYVDDGELIATPDGQVSKVPEQGQPTDSNLVSLPEGSRVLSNTLKVPGTNKTFAELGDKMMAKRKSKGKDIYAQNSDMLNDINNQLLHDKLFTMQENLKAKRGIKSKSKNVNAFDNGGLNTYKYDTTFKDYDKLYSPQYMNFVNSLKENDTASTSWLNRINSGEFGDIGGNRFSIANVKRLATDRKKGPVHNAVLAASTAYAKENPVNTVTAPNVDLVLDMPTDAEQSNMLDVSATPQDITYRKTSRDIRRERLDNLMNGLSGLTSGITSLAPIMSNLFTSDPESVPVNYNPYATAITNTMARRRYNIDPLLRDIDQNRAVANYAASQQRTNTGQDMAFRLQTAIAANKAKAAARATENNANNQYKAEYANTMNDLGKQWVNAVNLSQDLNAQNRAAARNIRRTGLSQLSQWGQNRELMRNQKNRDDAMMKLYDPFLQAGFTASDLEGFKKYLKKGGNR